MITVLFHVVQLFFYVIGNSVGTSYYIKKCSAGCALRGEEIIASQFRSGAKSLGSKLYFYYIVSERHKQNEGEIIMLETRNLCKVYKPKKGVPVTALNNVSLKFGEKGMVFLLGKSGSGKSTLLNLLGGLDKYDSGEIIIKGVSSKDFKQSHFDSYRNTYVGFIFQEYNILEEFSVGANIALALELQGKKATDKEINDILKEVDLEGYGNRKPNELSGGQKQRVAIARALVKNPKIIMADEPTGALDSNTGRQVFDTLKKLSREKLVIIVSHDREFSELYADRIIELSDGNVISDVELDNSVEAVEEGLSYDGDVIEVAKGYHLTEEDRIAINEYIDKLEKEGQNLKIGLAQRKNIKFKETNQDDIKMEDGSAFSLIKSKLPMKNAFKIGASGLKHKKFRLVMTILLSCVAFALFGLADTFASYNHVKTSTKSFLDTGINHLSLKKAVKVGKGINSYWDDYDTTISKDELKSLEGKLGIELNGVVEPMNNYLRFMNYDESTEFSKTEYDLYARYFTGYVEINDKILKDLGYEVLAGKLPDGSKNEIAISKVVYQTFEKGKYADLSKAYEDENFKVTYEEIKKYEDIIGKKIQVGDENKEYVITAVIDTHFDMDRYSPLMEEDEYTSTAENIIDYALYGEFREEIGAGLNTAIMVGEGQLDKIIAEQPKMVPLSNTWIYMHGSDSYSIDPYYVSKLSDIDANEITWLNGKKDKLGEKEVIIDASCIYFYEMSEDTSIKDMGLENINFDFNLYNYEEDIDVTNSNYKIVGIVDIDNESTKHDGLIILNDKQYDDFIGDEYTYGEYSYVVGAMPKEQSRIVEILEYCYDEEDKIQYQAQNAVSYELDSVNEGLKIFAKIFMYIGIGFAVFASLMLANFIGTSIAYKKQEIGILRAIGSRSNDVFRIFFSESFIIAMINFVISAVGVCVITNVINGLFRSEMGILVTVLSFGPRQVILLFVVSIAVAFLASFIPVKKIAAKKPIDAIRNR